MRTGRTMRLRATRRSSLGQKDAPQAAFEGVRALVNAAIDETEHQIEVVEDELVRLADGRWRQLPFMSRFEREDAEVQVFSDAAGLDAALGRLETNAAEYLSPAQRTRIGALRERTLAVVESLGVVKTDVAAGLERDSGDHYDLHLEPVDKILGSLDELIVEGEAGGVGVSEPGTLGTVLVFLGLGVGTYLALEYFGIGGE